MTNISYARGFDLMETGQIVFVTGQSPCGQRFNVEPPLDLPDDTLVIVCKLVDTHAAGFMYNSVLACHNRQSSDGSFSLGNATGSFV